MCIRDRVGANEEGGLQVGIAQVGTCQVGLQVGAGQVAILKIGIRADVGAILCIRRRHPDQRTGTVAPVVGSLNFDVVSMSIGEARHRAGGSTRRRAGLATI